MAKKSQTLTSLTLTPSSSPTAMTMIAEFFKMLSEVSRLEIVCALKKGPLTVSRIIEVTGLGQANVSKHLKLLTNAQILSRQQQGVNVVYEISNPIIFPLCDLVCNSLVNQIHYQNQALEDLKVFQN
jgi:DNA-binding transcriptional ArsR family regulator